MPDRSVHISGAGLISPAGVGRRAGFDGLLEGRTRVAVNNRFLVDGFKSRTAAPVSDPARSHSFARPDIADRHIAFAAEAAREAIEESELDLCVCGPEVSVVFATAIGATEALERSYRRSAPPTVDQLRFDTGADLIAEWLGLGPLRLTSTTGCTASLDALGCAFDLIRFGLSECVLVATGEAPIVPISLAAFDRIGAVSRCADPRLASRPFDRERDGFVLGEGGAAIVLESEVHLKRRRGRSLGLMLGWASVSSAFHMTAIRTDGQDVARAIDLALRAAGRRPEDVDFADLHATSTKMNDLAEANALRTVFGALTPVAVAQKAINGHALGASNLMEIVNDVTAIERGVLPPTPLCGEQDPECAIRLVRRPLKGAWRTALKVSSGFSGIHSAAVLQAPP